MSTDKPVVVRPIHELRFAGGWSVLAWGTLSLGAAIADEVAETSAATKKTKSAAIVEELPVPRMTGKKMAGKKETGKKEPAKKETVQKETAGSTSEKKAKAREASRAAISYEIEFPAPDPKTTEALLALHNHLRTEKGLAQFQLHPKLTAAAQRYAEYALRTGRLSHNADGRTPSERILAEGIRFQSWAENMAWGQPTPEQAMGSWLQSQAHHANILSEHTHVGFGRAGNVWVTVFAIPIESR